jgi:hypothetical protein
MDTRRARKRERRQMSRAGRRAAGMSDCVERKRRRAEVDKRQGRFDCRYHNAISNRRRVAGDTVMRTSEAENAVRAANTIRDAGRLLRGALAIVQTKCKCRSAVACLGWRRKAADRDQQALGGNGIRNDDAEQRPPHSLVASFQHCPPRSRSSIMRSGASGVNRANLERI